MFKSFKPKKYSRSKKYKQWILSAFRHVTDSHNQRRYLELCIECGYPYGRHFGSGNCPTEKTVMFSYLKPVKHGQTNS